ncbi:UNKNOWN [Stylonychia lemnae]|uniref:Uncharacterized protein n=1 Tax=Stylonychia lemnae TaxID=5949 RepID=A0A078AL03_STYLE|nr:UNKNOWN [Stylonychia lemnae]|eukprot:CDW82117.1 UNKNOWN [Stylonychia lemnae]
MTSWTDGGSIEWLQISFGKIMLKKKEIIYITEAIKSKKLELSNIGNQLGKKYIFGGDSPNSVSKFTPFDEQKYAETKFQMQNELYPSMSKMVMKSKYNKQRFVSPVGQSIRTYGVKEKMPYMDSSIDLTQDDYKRVAYHQNQDQFNMNEFRMKVAERSGRYKNDLQFGSTLTNPTQKFKVSNSFQTIEQQPIGDSDKILQQNGIQSLKSHKDLNLTQKIVIDNGYRHPYEWNLNNPTGPLGVLPDNKKITEISRDEGHALRKNASQLMQPFYDTKDSPTRQNKRYDSVIISPSNTNSIAQDSQIYNGTQSSHFQNFSRTRQDKINQYQKTLGIIEEPFKEVKLPALSHHRQQF